jgi:hypothetical protein
MGDDEGHREQRDAQNAEIDIQKTYEMKRLLDQFKLFQAALADDAR